MRPSAPSSSAMPTGPAYMGWWGSLGGPKQKGIITYSLASNQQRAFAGAFHGYLFYGYKRLAAQAPYFAIPFAIGYATYSWGKSKAAFYASKEGHLAEGGDH